MPDAEYATGMLFRDRCGGVEFAGSCFCYLQPTHFLTAAHCVTERTDLQYRIRMPMIRRSELIAVVSVERHPTADLALLVTPPVPGEQIEPYQFIAMHYTWGDESCAFGYPEDSTADRRVEPTPRLLRGSFQRFAEFKSDLGYTYAAAELSMGLPAGLSGGPVWLPRDTNTVAGVAAENWESSTFLRSRYEEESDGRVFREHIHSVINYGICVRLDPLAEWLHDRIPPLGSR
jgi:hypothetical protein